MQLNLNLHCWKCGSKNFETKSMRVGKERTSQKDIAEGCEDFNIYTKFHVCRECTYRWTPAQDKYLVNIVYNTARNEKIADMALRFVKAKQPVLIFIQLIEHGNLINIAVKEKLMSAGLSPELGTFVNGALDDNDNENVKKKFQDKEILSVITTNIWGEGTDVPSLRWVIYAKAGKPGIELEQVLGRSLRRSQGKWRAGFIDFLDEFNPTFATRSRARRRFLEQKGFAPKVLTKFPPKGSSSRKVSRFLVEK